MNPAQFYAQTDSEKIAFLRTLDAAAIAALARACAAHLVERFPAVAKPPDQVVQAVLRDLIRRSNLTWYCHDCGTIEPSARRAQCAYCERCLAVRVRGDTPTVMSPWLRTQRRIRATALHTTLPVSELFAIDEER